MTIHKCDICGNEIKKENLQVECFLQNGKSAECCERCLDKMRDKHKEIGDITIEYKKQIKITDKWYFDELKRLILGD